jgi:hypothetical protein
MADFEFPPNESLSNMVSLESNIGSRTDYPCSEHVLTFHVKYQPAHQYKCLEPTRND